MLRRYARTPLVTTTTYGTSYAIPVIRENIKNGTIRFRKQVLQEGERLDVLAGKAYGDGRLWWIIAAASEVGWGLQVPPGTIITIPELADVARYVG